MPPSTALRSSWVSTSVTRRSFAWVAAPRLTWLGTKAEGEGHVGGVPHLLHDLGHGPGQAHAADLGMSFYTGDAFPEWQGNLFVGSARRGEIPGTGGLERIVFNESLEELRRESLLGDLHRRVRDVRQGPDGLLYVLTDDQTGALLRIAPL